MDFRADYLPLDRSTPGWGTVALLPWDFEIFGFPVGEFRPGNWAEIGARQAAFAQRLDSWAREKQAELVSCRLSGADRTQSALLQRCGFRFVEASLRAGLAPLAAERLPEVKAAVRPAEANDRDRLLDIASSAFDSGRYHADPRMPRERADARYRFWLDNALSGPGAGTRVFVLGEPGRPAGFFHVEVESGEADLRLAAVDKTGTPGVTGFALYAGVLKALTAEGVRRATMRLTATNTPAVNLCAALGFRFADPEIVLHWHSPAATHLV